MKGKRLDSIEAQSAFLLHWEEKWEAPRLHGRSERRLQAMFGEERLH